MSDEYGTLTLRQALAHFREEHGLTQGYESTGERSKIFLDRHDTIHVLYGLDTSFRQEALSDCFTFFGTDAKWSDLRQYLDLPESKELFAEFGWPKLLGLSLLSLPSAFRAIFRARRIKRKWGWNEYDQWLDTPVSAIREEFGIGRDLVEGLA